MHRHACGHGHYWDCACTAIPYSETVPTVCMCLDHGLPMEDGDHSQCTIELLDCPLHRTEQAGSAESRLLAEDQIEQGWEPIQIPDNLAEMFQNWTNDPEANIGWCLLCNSAICTKDDLIPGTTTHNCAEGWALEDKPREWQRKGRS
jgi:hypothetical protein